MTADGGGFTIIGTRRLPPDPGVVDALGLNHALESALADLVDNSIDAHAQHVRIRFVRAGDRLTSLFVIDDGDGMTDTTIDDAMTMGRQRRYGSDALGHFGLGLKAASLSQADVLTVLSRARGDEAVGRRWVLERARSGFECDVVSPADAAAALDDDGGRFPTSHGTIVRWDAVRTFPGSSDPRVTTRWTEDAMTRIRHRLGMVFHRLLSAERIAIAVDVYDADLGASGPVLGVEPLDPFGYPRTGAGGYPKVLRAHHRTHRFDLVCHIWPRSESASFRLPGRTPAAYQGLYFYRHDRLLQPGGWSGVRLEDRRLALARVAIDLDDPMREFVAMNSEKNAITTRPAFAAAVEAAVGADGTTFAQYQTDAEATFRRGHVRPARRSPRVPPGTGVAAPVRRVAANEVVAVADAEPLAIRWKPLPADEFFDVDRDNHTIWLNSRFRAVLVANGRTSVSDAPLLKTLVYLLMEPVFQGSYLGRKDRDDIALWQALLTAAVEAEVAR
jgi:hypothetical protein